MPTLILITSSLLRPSPICCRVRVPKVPSCKQDSTDTGTYVVSYTVCSYSFQHSVSNLASPFPLAHMIGCTFCVDTQIHRCDMEGCGWQHVLPTACAMYSVLA